VDIKKICGYPHNGYPTWIWVRTDIYPSGTQSW